MGYDVHITRGGDWSKAEANPIGLEEWQSYVQSDSEMRLTGFAEARSSEGEVIRYESPGLAVWTAGPRNDEDGGEAWFDLRHGCIVVKNPDDDVLRKMCAIAIRLNAQVQGDEGEFYSPGRQNDSPPPGRPWWKRLFGG